MIILIVTVMQIPLNLPMWAWSIGYSLFISIYTHYAAYYILRDDEIYKHMAKDGIHKYKYRVMIYLPLSGVLVGLLVGCLVLCVVTILPEALYTHARDDYVAMLYPAAITGMVSLADAVAIIWNAK